MHPIKSQTFGFHRIMLSSLNANLQTDVFTYRRVLLGFSPLVFTYVVLYFFSRSLKVTLGRVTPRQAIGSSAIVSLSDCQPAPDFLNKTHS